MTLLSTLRKFLLCCLLLLSAVAVKATHYYVDSSATVGANNGLSWANAFKTVQPAINFAVAGDTLWIADGHYYPGLSGDNTAWMDLKNGVVLLGGFQGLSGAQETSASQRNFISNHTIFSGDLDKNGVHSAADAYHVVNSHTKDTTAVVDGIIIELGYAVGPAIHSLGGGIFSYGGGGSYYNCVIQDNYAADPGGGIYAVGSFKFRRCLFKSNGSGAFGGAIGQSNSGARIRVHNCAFVGNTAAGLGAAITADALDFQVFNCTFTGNVSNSVSGIYSGSSTLQIRNCIFWGNPGTDIAGTPIVTGCIVEGGYAPGTNILNVNPEFLDAIGRIGSCSPAVDVGDSLAPITVDYDGNARPVDGDGNVVAKWDLGAFEAQVPRSYPAPNSIVGANPACARSFNNLYRVGTDNSPTNTYQWSLASGGTISGTNANDSIRVNWGGTLGTYLLTVKEINAANGCFTTTSIAVALSAAPTVILNPAPNDSICTGDSVLVTLSGSGISQQWYRNGIALPGATATTIFAKQSGYYNAIKLGSNGCSDSAAVSLRVYLRPLPTVTFTTSIPTPICQGNLITITGSPGAAHQWFRNGATLSGATLNTYTTGLAGRYNMRQTDAFGCRDSAAVGLNLIVNSLPIVTLSPLTTDTICIGDSLPISASALSAVSRQWFRNQVAIPASNVNPYRAFQSGVFNCRLTNANGCTDSAAVGKKLIVNDFVNPVAICRNVTVYLSGAGAATLTSAMVNNGSTDNCRIASFGLSASNMTCGQLGANAVTLTATDFAGRTSTCVSTVTVLDSIRPVATCNSATVYLGTNGQFTLNPAVVGGSSTDNCAIALATVTPSNFVCADTGSRSILYRAQDASGNFRTCTTSIILRDSTRPNAICRTATIFLNGLGNAATTAAAVNNGSTDNCGIASMSISRTNFTCVDVPGAFVNLTLRDVSGNVGTCQGYVRVVDSVAPVPHCRDTTIYINFSGIAILTPTNLNNNSTDNCAIDSLWIGQSAFTCADTGANNVTLSVADADTNTRTCISIVTILDTIPPQAICTNTTFALNASGIAVVNPAIFGASSFDNCTFFDTAYVNVGPYNCAQTGPHIVKLFVVDVNSRIDSCSGTVTIVDNLAPTARCNNLSPILSPGGTVSISVGQVNNASTDNCSIATTAISASTFTCANVGPNNVVLTVTDIFGNVGTCTSVVTVTDTVAPQAVCRNVTAYLNGAGTTSVTTAQVNNGSTDNCGTVVLALSATSFVCTQTGSNNVTLTVTDGFGNARTCTGVVTVLDTIRPVAACRNATGYVGTNGQFVLTPTLIDNGGTDNCGIATRTLSLSNFTCAQIGANAVTLTFADPSGLTHSCTSTVTVLDTLDPIAACTNGTFNLNAAGSLTLAVSNVASGSTDNCGITTSSLSQTAFTCAHLGPNTLTVSFVDASGNTSTCNVIATIVDNVAPIAACLNPTLILNPGGNASLTVGNVDGGSTDACGIITRTLSTTTFNCSLIGSNVVTLTVTDASGNAGTCLSTVTVVDTLDPVIVCTTATVYLASNGSYALSPSLLTVGSTDVCGIDTAYASTSVFSCADIGVNVIHVFVEDGSGNMDSCTTSFTLLDNLAPVADCDSVSLQLGSNGLATLTPQVLGPNSSDNCGIDSSTISQSIFSCGNTGWIAVTLSLWDSTGNQSTCIGHVLVVDTTGAAAAQVSLGADTTACNGDVIIFDAGAGMSTYLWSTGDTTQAISVSTAGTYTVQVVSPQGCAGEDTVVVSAFVSPNPNLRTESGNAVVCMNDTLRLLVNPLFTSYQWSTGAMTTFTDITTGGNYSVVVTDANGCDLLRTITVQYSPFPGPNPQIVPGGNVGMCENTTVELDAGAGYYVYQWTTGQTAQVITAFVPGVYSVQVWNGFGCHATSNDVTVSLIPSAYPDINRNADTLFTNTIATSYQWYLGSVPILGATARRYTASLPGSYTVRVVYANGCSQTSSPLPFTVGLLDELTLLEGIELFPNPSDGHLQLRVQHAIKQPLMLRVTDMYGRQLYHNAYRSLRDELALDLADLPAGMYLLEMKTAGASTVRRIVIE